MVEATTTSNWTLIEGYHQLGQVITENRKALKEEGINPIPDIAKAIGRSKRTVQRAVQFYKKYPDLSLLPEGKVANWHRVVNKYLPETTKDKVVKLSYLLTLNEVDSIIDALQARNTAMDRLQLIPKFEEKRKGVDKNE